MRSIAVDITKSRRRCDDGTSRAKVGICRGLPSNIGRLTTTVENHTEHKDRGPCLEAVARPKQMATYGRICELELIATSGTKRLGIDSFRKGWLATSDAAQKSALLETPMKCRRTSWAKNAPHQRLSEIDLSCSQPILSCASDCAFVRRRPALFLSRLLRSTLRLLLACRWRPL